MNCRTYQAPVHVTIHPTPPPPSQDQAQTIPFSTIKQIIERGLGVPLSHTFPTFNPTPIAAASIAQVHQATLPDSTPVAVKVQLPHITAALKADMLTLTSLTNIASWLFPDFPLDWAVKHLIERLASELDFKQEAKNFAQVGRSLPSDGGVVVPKVFLE